MKAARKDWKKSKKLLLWITAAAMALCLGACSDQAGQDVKESKEASSVETSSESVNKGEEESKEEDKKESKEENKEKNKEEGKKVVTDDLLEHARKTLDLTLEKARSKTYLEMMGNESLCTGDEYQKLVSGDYSSPEKIYRIRFKEEFNNLLFTAALDGNSLKINELSEELRKDMEGRLAVSFVTVLNARKSAKTVALASVISTGNLYLDENMASGSGMLLYCYKDAYPLVVNFGCTEDGIVSMTGNVVFYDDFNAESGGDVVMSILDYFPEELKFLAGTGIEIEEIQ